MTRELYERVETLEAKLRDQEAEDVTPTVSDKVEAILAEGVTDTQRNRIAERLGIFTEEDDEGNRQPDGDALVFPVATEVDEDNDEDNEGGDNE